ncbi:MAG: hypothetical protein DM484_05460 [Candidatus Methylumidiphilus alinenensis]|uniref:Uncharacterized protein n=1 Tax=Candidatus Methylumidiphilus alinenensis TaxID=2202197 RepID=A0A2W4RK75_9GAMM|nr:MAG: hypothetical protein DM484_05460 [Candidatus Methylumidiphilus alinenensis]
MVTPEGILLYALRSVWVKLYAPRIAFVNALRQKNAPICKIKIHIDESMGMDGSAILKLPSMALDAFVRRSRNPVTRM